MSEENNGQSTAIGNGIPPEIEDATPTSRKVDPGFKRNLLIIGGGVGVVAAATILVIVLSQGSASKDAKRVVSVELAQGTSANGDEGQLSPALAKGIKTAQMNEQAAAKERGDKMFIPQDTLANAVPIAPPPNEVIGTGAGATAPNQNVPVAYQYSEEERAQNDRRRAGMEIQLGQLVEAEGGGGGGSQRVVFDRSQLPAANTGAAQAQTGAPAAVVDQGTVIAEGLEIAPGETASPIDTYRTKYASARIVAGKLSGAFLVGSTELMEEGLSTTYSMMRFNNKTYKIDAIALDEKTSTDAMAADIDRRPLARYVMPVLAAVGGAALTAISTPGSLVVNGAAATTVSTPPPTGRQAAAAGGAAGMQIIQREVDIEAAKPNRATLPAGTSIGIMFRGEVREMAR